MFLNDERSERERIALERTSVRSRYRINISRGWTFANLQNSTPKVTGIPIGEARISASDLETLRNDGLFASFLYDGLDGLDFDSFQHQDRKVQIAVVQMFGVWKHPRIPGTAAMSPTAPTEIAGPSNKRPRQVPSEEASQLAKKKRKQKRKGNVDEADEAKNPTPPSRSPNATKVLEFEIKRLYRMITVPVATFDEMLTGLPEAMRALITKVLLPSHRRCINAARLACTRMILQEAATENGISNDLELKKIFCAHYDAAAKGERLTTMGQSIIAEEYAKHFVGQVVVILKRNIFRLHKVCSSSEAVNMLLGFQHFSPFSKIWVQQLIEAIATNHIRPEFVKGVTGFINRVVAGFPGNRKEACKKANDLDTDDDDDQDDDDEDGDGVDGDGDAEQQELLLEELLDTTDFTEDLHKLKDRFERIFLGKRLTLHERVFRDGFGLLQHSGSPQELVSRLRNRFLHPRLIESGRYPAGGAATDMSRVVVKNTYGKLIQFMYDVNRHDLERNPMPNRGILQLLCPQPSLHGGYIPETATTFAGVSCECIKILDEARRRGGIQFGGVEVPASAYTNLIEHLEMKVRNAITEGCKAMSVPEPTEMDFEKRIIEYNAIRDRWLAGDPSDPTGLRRYVAMSSSTNPMLHPMIVPKVKNGRYLGCGFRLYLKAQPFLFFAFMPGLHGFVGARWEKGQHVWVKHSYCTDGHGIRVQLYDLNSHTARKSYEPGLQMGGSDRARASRFKASFFSLSVVVFERLNVIELTNTLI
jgi:hypothetical protein